MSSQYASVAIFDLGPANKVSISVISVTPNEVVLSGSWVLEQHQDNEISLILSDRLAIPLTKATESAYPEKKYGYTKVSLSDFFVEARLDAASSLEAFNQYRNEDLKKRKNLVPPFFYDWSTPPDLLEAEGILGSLGIPGTYEGTVLEMKRVLAAARLVLYFISKWQNDETARSGRKYVDGAEAQITILPRKWMS
ncbi:hypothetical protein MCEMRE22_00908 [Candidatus Nanopelagicaceae bacterium]